MPASSPFAAAALWLRIALFGAACFACSAVADSLVLQPASFANYWVPTGLVVAVLLRSRQRHWLPLLLSAFAVEMGFYLWNGQAVHVSFILCCGNCLETLAGAWLVRRFVAERPDLSTVREVAGLIGCVALLSAALGVTAGAAVVMTLGEGGSYGSTWLLWWSSDVLGALLLAPLILAWRTDVRHPLRWRPSAKQAEAALFIVVLCLCAVYVFRDDWHRNVALKYVMFSFVIWAAFRFGVWGTAMNSLAVAAIAAWLTVRGFSDIATAGLPPWEQVIALHLYLAVLALSGLFLAAALSERRRAERERGIATELLRLINESRSTQELVQATVRFFHQQSGCEALGVRLRDGDDYPYFESRGFPPEFLLLENQLCARDAAGEVVRDSAGDPLIECMCGNVICGRFDPAKPFFTPRGSFWTNSTTELLATTTEADRLARTRNRCNTAGYESLALLPLRVGEERLGLVQLNDRRKGMFAAETIALWERLAGYLAIALSKLRADEALRESEFRFRRIVENAEAGYFLIGRDGRFQDVNDSWLKMHGYASREEIVGRHFSVTQVEKDIADAGQIVDSLIEGRSFPTGEFSRRRADGSIAYHTFTVHPVSRGGSVVGAEGFLIDSTARKLAEESLRESELRLRETAEAGNVGLWDWNLRTNRVHYSAEWKRQIGYDDREISDDFSEWQNRVHPDDLEATVQTVRAFVEKPWPNYRVEFRFRHKDGSYRWILTQASVLIGEDGKPCRMLGSHVDITDRKRAEEALRQSEERYRTVVEDQTEIIGRFRADGTLTFVNEVYCRYFGKTSRDLLGTMWHPRALSEDLPQIEERLRTMSPANPVAVIENRVYSGTGEVRWMQFVNRGFYDAGGRLIEIQAVGRDITDRKQAEEELARVLNLSPDMICVAATDGYFKQVNPAWEKTLGYTAEELLARPFVEFIHPDDLAITMAEVQRQLFGQETFNFINRYRCKDGTYKWFDWVSQPSPDGTLLYAAARDVTERKRIEDSLRESEARYRSLFVNMLNGFAYCRMIFEQDRPHDFIYLAVNKAFETLTGLKDVEGRKASEAIPGIRESDQGLLEIYGRVARTGTPERFEIYVEALRMWFAISVYGAGQDHFVAVFDVITERKRTEEALRTSEAMHRALVQGLPDVVVRFDRAGRHLFVSDNVEDVMGIAPRQFISRTHRELGFPRHLCDFWEDAIRRVFDGGTTHETEFSVQGKRGLTTFNWRLVPESDAQGKTQSVLSISRDITAHREAERNYQTLFREMLDGFALHEIMCDAQGEPFDYRFLTVNPAFERMTGLTAEAVVGRTVRQVLPNIEPHWIETYGRVAMMGEPAYFENYAADLGKHFQVTAFRPTANHFACMFADITERKRAEASLLENQTELQAIYDNAPVMMCVLNTDRQIQYVNRALAAFVGKPQTGLVHDRACGILGCINALDDHRGCGFGPNCGQCTLRLAMLDTMLTGKSHTGIEYCATLRLNQTFREVTLLGSTARIRSAGQDMLLLCLADITELKRAEERQRQLEAQVLHAQKLESLGVLAGGIAHDFNNLLGAIVSNVDLAKQQLPPGSPVQVHVERSLRAAARAADLTRQMLTYSGKGHFLVRKVDLSALVEENAHLLQACIFKEAELQLDLRDGLPPVEADPGQLQQVVMNLITNAAEALGGQPGTVSLRTGIMHCDEAALSASRVEEKPPAGKFVFLRVSDTGCGMDDETKQRLFDPFFSTKFTGRGLGLSSVLGIVRGHRGAIFVDSAVGTGTTVKVLFPAAAPGADTGVEEASPAPPPSRLETPQPSFSGTVLMADDDDMARLACQAVLTSFGFQVLVAADGEEAVRVFREHADTICCVVLDLTMPKMDGLAAFQAMREIREDVKVVLVSGYDESEATRQFGGGGLAGFVQKPYRQHVLAEEIRRVLQKG